MVALKIYFYFINHRLLNPKKAFECCLLLGAAEFLYFGLFWVWEKRYYSRYSFQKCQKTNTYYTSISNIIVHEPVRKSWQAELLNAVKVHCISSTYLDEIIASIRILAKTQKTKSFLTLNHKLFSLLHRFSSKFLCEKNYHKYAQFSFPYYQINWDSLTVPLYYFTCHYIVFKYFQTVEEEISSNNSITLCCRKEMQNRMKRN